MRKTDDLEVKCDGLLKQNSHLAQDNDQLARELAERRYELERLKVNSLQLQERDAIKTGQLAEVNRSLELEIDLLKKERLESNKLYESHIQKLEFMLEDKIKEVDLLSVRLNESLNEKEVSEIRFEEEKNKLKNLMNRTSHEMERELEYTKEKQTTEKYVEIETLKKNYTSQILLLEDEISKLKAANDYKHNEFENQLADNKNLRNRYEQELKTLEQDNSALRDKIQKLEELNRSEVVNIEVKYKNLQQKDANELISGHVQEMKTMIAEIDKLNWLLRDKNQEIQNLIREKKEQKAQEEERELAFRAEIDTLKNKLDVQQEKYTNENHELTSRVAALADKLHRDSDAYHDRVNQLHNNVNELESELKSKQNEIDRTLAENAIKQREQQKAYEEISSKLDRTRRDLADAQKDHAFLSQQFSDYKTKTDSEISALTKKNRELETEREELHEKLERHADHSGDQEKILRLEIASLNKNIAILEKSLSQEQANHAKEMNELSTNLKAKLDKLQAQQKKTISEIETSRANELEALNRRIEKLNRDREEANKKLAEYVKLYSSLEKHFKNPAEGSICRERGASKLYEVLEKVNESTINIF